MSYSDRGIDPSIDVLRSLGEAAQLSERAIVVGNRAGVVEWANSAWTRITGFPLAETIAKPITHFLQQTSIDIELVDFVGQNFLDGRTSTIEFPFQTFDDRQIWVHLEVQPIRNTQREITEFVAVATDVSERRQQEIDTSRRRPEPQNETTKPALVLSGGAETRLSLSAEVGMACDRFMRTSDSRITFDLELDARLPSIRSNRLRLGEVLQRLLSAATVETDENWGFVTVMTGRTRLARSHVSAAHPVPARIACLADAEFAFLEVHDTAPSLSPALLRAIEAGGPCGDLRADSLAIAAALAGTLGGRLHIDSTPGCGTQSLLLLPLGDEPN